MINRSENILSSSSSFQVKTDLKPFLSKDNSLEDFSVTSAPVIKFLEKYPDERKTFTSLQSKDPAQVSELLVCLYKSGLTHLDQVSQIKTK